MDFTEFLQAGIIGVFGKPGAGKSFFATKVILEEIKGENRPIVTNVPINRKEVAKHVSKDFFLHQLETFGSNMYFFSQRGDYTLDLPDHGLDEAVDFKEYMQAHDEGVLYVIDEAGLYFNSRNWRMMKGSTLSYFTFIRHIGDTCLWLSQAYGDVDKQIRGKTQSFNLIRNLSKERFGWFKRGAGFRVYQYLEENGIDGQTPPQQDFAYRFDKKIAKCYQTSLFNKQRDKDFKVKGFSLKWALGFVVCCVLAFIAWVATGGLTDTAKALMPNVGSKETQEVVAKAQVGGQFLPVMDPFKMRKDVPLVGYEYPFQSFPGYEQSYGQVEVNATKRLDDYFFGLRRYCTITFITESKNDIVDRDMSFSAILQTFAQDNQLAVAYSAGTFEMATSVFKGAVKWIKDNGRGKSIKTVKVIVKENVPFHLKQGFEIPLQKSVAVQGAIQTNIDYKEIGFDLVLILEATSKGELLGIQVKNNEVMDMTAQVPILASFESQNVLEVQDGMTYELADFLSLEEDESKGYFKKRHITRSIRNHVYISYGN